MADPMDFSLNLPQILQRTLPGQPGAQKVQGANEPLDKACRDFESLFVSHMMQEMRKTVPEDGLFSGGRAEQMFTSVLDNEMAKSISTHRGLGLAPMLYQQLASQTSLKKNE